MTNLYFSRFAASANICPNYRTLLRVLVGSLLSAQAPMAYGQSIPNLSTPAFDLPKGSLSDTQFSLAELTAGPRQMEFDSIVPHAGGGSLPEATVSGLPDTTVIPQGMPPAAKVGDPPIVVRAPLSQAQMEADEASWVEDERQQKLAVRYEIAYLALSVVDGIASAACVGSGKCRELNPLMRGPIGVIGGKILMSGIQYLLFNNTIKKDPIAAKRIAQFGVLLQGAITGLSLKTAF